MASPQTLAKLAVLIPTYRRPDLLIKALDSLKAQNTAAPFKIVVSDNDADNGDGERTAIAWAQREGLADHLQTIRIRQRGLSSNRNGGLQHAFSDPNIISVSMMDDDSEADQGWISAIQNALSKSKAFIFGGPTIYSFEVPVLPWIESAEMFRVPFDVSGPVPRLRSANNCTITRTLFEQMGLSIFDSAFDRKGGEDVHLFERCRKLRLQSDWIMDAIVREMVPARRCSGQWVIERHRWGAANAAHIDMMLNGTLGAVKTQAPLILKELAGGTLKMFSRNPGRRFSGRLRFAGIAGRLDGLKDRLILHDTETRI